MKTGPICLIAVLSLIVGCSTRETSDPSYQQSDDVRETRDVVSRTDVDVAEPPDGGGEPDESVDPGPEATHRDVEVTTCEGPAIPTGDDACVVTPGSPNLVVLRGTILAPDEVIENGWLAYSRNGDQGVIECLGCDCSGISGFEQATVIECADGVISAGLINPHDHITFSVSAPQSHGNERYEHRHDWRRGNRGHSEIDVDRNNNGDGTIWGELRMLMGGVTSIVGSGGSDGLIRNLDQDQEGLRQGDVFNSTFPLDDSSGRLVFSGCGYSNDRDRASRTTVQDAYLPHVAEGIDQAARNEFLCLSSNENGGEDVIEANTAIIHGIGLTASDISEMSLNGSTLIWSPRSNIDLYGNTAQVTLFHNLGVPIALGTDWSASGSMNMLRELQCADEFNTNNLSGYFTDYELYLMATEWAAFVTATDDVIGSLREGYVADITVFDGQGRDPIRAVLDAEAGDVTMVVRGGTVLFADTNIIEGLRSDALQCDVLDVCGTSKRVCLDAETGLALDELENRIGGDEYPLFFCGAPASEPTCIPSREGEYTGQEPSDADADGIPDASDNCPATFNPIRPLDNGAQPDHDLDQLGDVCDPCPFDADGSQCARPVSGDRDGDGLLAGDDNCLDVYNPEQLDTDSDGIGDLCDACPEQSNEGGAGCVYTIQQLRDPAGSPPPTGTSVQVSNVIVTATQLQRDTSNAYYIQSLDDVGADYSGILVYTGADLPVTSTGAAVEAGMVLSLTGETTEFRGIAELVRPTSVVLDRTEALPHPRLVTAADLTPDSETGEALESLFVRLEDVHVARYLSDDPESEDEEDEFYVADSADDTCSGETPSCALVGDFLIDGGDDANNSPNAEVGQTYSSIVGLVNGFDNRYSLDVRYTTDLTQ